MAGARPPSDNRAQAQLAKAVALHHRGKLNAADAAYRSVLKRTPDHAGALNGRAMVANARGHHQRALELLHKARHGFAEDPGYHMNLGCVLVDCNRLSEAEKAFCRAIELRADYADPYYNLGDLYLRQGQPDRAIATFDACMTARGRDFHALAYKAHALGDAGRTDDAQGLLDHERLLKRYDFTGSVPSLAEFNERISQWLACHPSLQVNAMSTRQGKHTGNLVSASSPQWLEIESIINAAVNWYSANLDVEDSHPMQRWQPAGWSLTAWGVVMSDGGYERSHIHPKGWLSGVLYLHLPPAIADEEDEGPAGWLEFGRPTPELHVSRAPDVTRYRPRYGEMFLFPSYFYHATVPFRSSDARICLAFDVEPIAYRRPE